MSRPALMTCILAMGPHCSSGNQLFQEVLGESLHAVPFRVHVVARHIGAEVAWLVTGNPLHHVPLDEPVLGVEQSATKKCHSRGTPARLLLEIFDIAPCLIHVPVSG